METKDILLTVGIILLFPIIGFIQYKLIKSGKFNDFEKKEKFTKLKETINDEVAYKTDFSPLNFGGSNIKQHKLIYDNSGNIIFKATKTFPIIFLGFFGIISSGMSIEFFYSNMGKMTFFPFIFLFIALIFIYFLAPRTKIFDLEKGYFYEKKYEKNLFELINNEKYKNKIIFLKDIYALQIINKTVRSSQGYSSFTNYDLNIVLKTGNRIKITNYLELNEIRNDVEIIAKKLGLKIWDITKLNYIE